eukprot:8101983-Pyramimonas_sp.AAC.1
MAGPEWRRSSHVGTPLAHLAALQGAPPKVPAARFARRRRGHVGPPPRAHRGPLVGPDEDFSGRARARHRARSGAPRALRGRSEFH